MIFYLKVQTFSQLTATPSAVWEGQRIFALRFRFNSLGARPLVEQSSICSQWVEREKNVSANPTPCRDQTFP